MHLLVPGIRSEVCK